MDSTYSQIDVTIEDWGEDDTHKYTWPTLSNEHKSLYNQMAKCAPQRCIAEKLNVYFDDS